MTYKVRQNDSSPVFCVEKEKSAPNYGSNGSFEKRSCTYLDSGNSILSEKEKVAIGEAIMGLDQQYYFTTEYYYGMQLVIDKFLYDKKGASVNTPISGSLSFSGLDFTPYYNVAVYYYNKFGNENLSFGSSLNFQTVNNYYTASVKINDNFSNKVYTVSLLSNGRYLDNSYVTITDGYAYINIPKGAITSSSNIELNITASTDYYKAVVNTCGEGWQSIAEATQIDTVTVTKTATATGTLSNNSTCDDWLTIDSKTPSSLIKLYQEKYPNYKGLLNFDNPSCSVVEKDINLDSSCMSVRYGTGVEFSKNNISNYNDILQINGETVGYCLTSIEFFKNDEISLPLKFKGGQFIAQGLAGTVNVIKECYIFKQVDNIDNNYQASDYIELDIENETLYQDEELSYTFVDDNMYTFIMTNNVYFPFVSIKHGTGEKYSDANECVLKKNNEEYFQCIEERGLLSKFLYNKNTIDFNYTLKIPNNNTLINETKLCDINIENELINDSGKLNLEFRIISTFNPFPGISGQGRLTGSNWCYLNDCLSTNNTVKENICLKNNSYNSTGQGYKYKITLTPDAISSIRKYNATTRYDDYNLISGVTTMKSLYLEELESQGILERREVPEKSNKDQSVCSVNN